MNALFFLAAACSAMQCSAPSPGRNGNAYPGLHLVWSDEFDYSGLPDPKRWNYDTGDACDLPMGCGWGNNELQYYAAKRLKNARVEDGKLIIEADREAFETRQYTSARLHTKGKGDWLYGRIEARIKVPSVRGSWAAFWMLPSTGTYGGWPHSGEIDIMEHVGYLPDSIIGNIHTLVNNGMHGTDMPGRYHQPAAKDAFHVYAIDWTEEKIDFLVDGNVYLTYFKTGGSEVWPFDQPFHLLLNLAVGGWWGGKYGVDENAWPQRMAVDYVRVYQAVTR